jgi:hypothetical protein
MHLGSDPREDPTLSLIARNIVAHMAPTPTVSMPPNNPKEATLIAII